MCKIHCYDIILPEPFTSFFVTLWFVTITVTMSSDATDMWQHDHDVTLTLTLSFKIKKKRKENILESNVLNSNISTQYIACWTFWDERTTYT